MVNGITTQKNIPGIKEKGVFVIELISELEKLKGAGRHLYEIDEVVTRSLYCKSIFYRNVKAESIIKGNDVVYSFIDDFGDVSFLTIQVLIVEDNIDPEFIIVTVVDFGVYKQERMDVLNVVDYKSKDSIYNN